MEGDRKLRVLQGVTGQAGQPHAIAAGLRRLGADALACTIDEHRFGYPTDMELRLPHGGGLAGTLAQLAPLIDRFDVFHFHARSLITRWPQRYPSLLDLLMLKIAGKKVFFHFRGQEIRLADKFRDANKYHYVDDDPNQLFQKKPEESKYRFLDFVNGVCDGVFVVDPELQSYVPGALIIPRVLDEEAWPFVGVGERAEPVVVHAPNRRGVKGTDAVLAAVDSLKRAGVAFQFRLVENLPHQEAAAIYRDADIVIDQLRIGWYGVLATEAMALGKPTIAYVRPDLAARVDGDLPIVNATPDDIADKLRLLIGDAGMRRNLAERSRAYFLKTHAAGIVCRNLLEIYEGSLHRQKQIDWGAVGRFLDFQNSEAEALGERRAHEAAQEAAKIAADDVRRAAERAVSAALAAADIEAYRSRAQRARSAPGRRKGLFDPPYRKVPARLLRRLLRLPL